MIKTLHHPNGSSRQIHLGGWKKQFTDSRDETYRLKLHGKLLGIPAAVDQRSICSPIEDQGNLGSCTAHMFSALVESNEIKRTKPALALEAAATAQVTVANVVVQPNGQITFMATVVPPPAPQPAPPAPNPPPAPPAPPAPTPAPAPTPNPPPAPAKLVRASRLFEYYGTRKIEGTVGQDAGATIRDAIKCGALYGVVDESLWIYDVAKFTLNPPQTVWSTAATHKITSYHAIADGDLETMKSAISTGFLVGFGFAVYDYMLTADMATKGMLPLPGPNEQLQGGHAVCLVGYDDSKVIARADGTKSTGAFLVRNSWGTGWGWQGSGYFWMSYDYVGNTRMCNDFWVIVSAPI